MAAISSGPPADAVPAIDCVPLHAYGRGDVRILRRGSITEHGPARVRSLAMGWTPRAMAAAPYREDGGSGTLGPCGWDSSADKWRSI